MLQFSMSGIAAPFAEQNKQLCIDTACAVGVHLSHHVAHMATELLHMMAVAGTLARVTDTCQDLQVMVLRMGPC
jgi:hypothetical protein